MRLKARTLTGLRRQRQSAWRRSLETAKWLVVEFARHHQMRITQSIVETDSSVIMLAYGIESILEWDLFKDCLCADLGQHLECGITHVETLVIYTGYTSGGFDNFDVHDQWGLVQKNYARIEHIQPKHRHNFILTLRDRHSALGREELVQP